jgi:sterol desaturase/sphingolipid hydroxylase (fatty acid hydroxylase superfamily)
MEAIIRFIFSFGIFFIMVCWEYFRPRRKQCQTRRKRWPINLGLAFFNLALIRISVGAIAYQSAVYAAENNWGLLNGVAWPQWLNIAITLLFLDFAIYCQHVIAHKWPLLWRLHQIHHTDLDFDATTAVRFHPLEIIISMAYKIFCIILIGAEPLAVIAFEIILNGCATFNHSNVNIPVALDKKLRWLLVTPDMHRIHHSTIPEETDSNYGFSISCWDRLCRTYTAEPKNPQTTMSIGLAPFKNPAELSFSKLLLLPFLPLRPRLPDKK